MSDDELDPTIHPTKTVDQTALLLKIGRSTAFRAIQSGDIPSISIGRRLLVPTAALRRMLQLDDPSIRADVPKIIVTDATTALKAPIRKPTFLAGVASCR